MTRFIILYSPTYALDGLDDYPLMSVDVIGTADDDVAAIEIVDQHRNTADLADEGALREKILATSRRLGQNKIWFLRGAGRKGREIHAGLGDATLYRIIPIDGIA